MLRKMKYILFCCVFLFAVYILQGCGRIVQEETGFVTMEEDSGTEEASEAEEDYPDASEVAQESDLEESEADCVIYVDVCGQVNNPGVYELPGESRVFEAIEKAGGMTKAAASGYLNKAEKLSDGQQIYVPSEKEIEENSLIGASTTENSSASGDKVNLNTASKEELMTLAGIGEAKAESIIRYREEHGNFRTTEDIKNVDGIKDGVFNKVKDQITV